MGHDIFAFLQHDIWLFFKNALWTKPGSQEVKFPFCNHQTNLHHKANISNTPKKKQKEAAYLVLFLVSFLCSFINTNLCSSDPHPCAALISMKAAHFLQHKNLLKCILLSKKSPLSVLLLDLCGYRVKKITHIRLQLEAKPRWNPGHSTANVLLSRLFQTQHLMI